MAAPDRRSLADLEQTLADLASPQRAASQLRFFKTGPGQYGDGDRFLGVAVPDLRRAARAFADLPPADVESLLRSPFHEERQVALLILVGRFQRGDGEARRRACESYLANLDFVNSWDLVDCSAPYLLGPYLRDGDGRLLEELARSGDLWRCRIAMVATASYIREGEFAQALKIAEILVDDRRDLVQKAVGWMLREIGDRDRAVELEFLDRHHRTMPRTALRYAVEKLPEAERRRYLARSPAAP